MSTLLSGYGSSDDEPPVASSSRLAKAAPATNPDEVEDDETLEQAARVDAFGLATAQPADHEGMLRAEKRRKEEVMAAPDVLKYVSTPEGGIRRN